jgi:cyclopropane fatty-acyl-phospholipid synthase-like methyltransferase
MKFFLSKNNRKIKEREQILKDLELNEIKPKKLKNYKKYDKSYFDDAKLGIGYGKYKNDGRFEESAKKFIKFFKLKKKSNILEIGCAKGYLINELKKKGMNVYGIDVSKYAVSKSHKDIKKNIIIRNIEKGIPFEDNFFDLIISKDTLPLIKLNSLKNVINEINRVSKNKKNIFLQIQGVSKVSKANMLKKWDPTHKICLTKFQWSKKLKNFNYKGHYEIKNLF